MTDTGFTGAGADLRSTVQALLPGATRVNTGLAWTFSGDIEVDLGATDNVGNLSNQNHQNQWQFFTLISPDFYLRGDTRRLQVQLAYSPRLAVYPQTSGETYLANNFNGSATLTVIPDWFFIDARGISEVTSRFGGQPLTSDAFLNNNEAVQTASFSISPYIQHTFAGWGTLNAGVAYERTFQSGNNSNFFPVNNVSVANSSLAASTAGFGTIGDLSTTNEFASFTTGENLGRVQDTISINASQNGGSSFYQGSSTLIAENQVSYALNRWLALVGTIGYEQYRYPQGAFDLNEFRWLIGVTVTPNPDSTITVEYGRVAGSSTIIANGTYAPTARTRVYGSYNVGIQTGLGARQGLLSTTVVGPGGVLLDRTTGAPVVASNVLASQSPLSRVKTLTLGGSLLLSRDTFTVSVTHDDTTQLVNSTSVFGVSTAVGTNASDTLRKPLVAA